MKRLVAAVLTVALTGVVFWSGSRRADQHNAGGENGVAVTDSSPESRTDPAQERIQLLLDAAWRGDVPAYLDAFTGSIRSRLEREVSERGREAFAEALKRSARARKSHAVF